MDSGNSNNSGGGGGGGGSIQSSSGADDEYDSRAHSSSFPPPPHPFTTTTTTPNPHTLHHHHHMFDPLSNYHLDPNALLNLDTIMWSKSLRSQPNQPDFTAFIPSSSSSPQQNQGLHHSDQPPAFYALQQQQQPDPVQNASSSRGGSMLNSAVSAANTNLQVRNPKKRSRASRRAPTTVLTTDTANFRAMVQEFTGIPAPPFTSSALFPRTTSFDLFGSSSSSAVRSTLLDPSPTPPYLLRPFAHKPNPFHPPSANSISTNSVTNSTHAVNNFHQLSPYPPPPFTFNNNPNIFTFQSPSRNHSSLPSKTQPPLEIPPPNSTKVGVFEELGLMRQEAHVSNYSNLGNNASSTEWAQRSVGTVTNDDSERGTAGGGGGPGGEVHYSANSSSDLRGEKARSQGTMEPWINN